MSPLTGKQKRHLRGLGHRLNPVVYVGQRGIGEAVMAKLNEELFNHELIKVKVSGDAPEGTKEAAAQLSKASGAELVQVIGRTVLLYKRRKSDPEIELP